MNEHSLLLNSVPRLQQKISEQRVMYYNHADSACLVRIKFLRWCIERIFTIVEEGTSNYGKKVY